MLVSFHNASHTREVGIARNQAPERAHWIFPTGIRALDGATEVLLEHPDRFGDDAPHFGIHRGVPPVLAVRDAQSLDLALGRGDVVEVSRRDRVAVARIRTCDYTQHQSRVRYGAAHGADVLERI